jgi:hypothetical protein
MKRSFSLFFLSVVFFTTTAQQYDLIITKTGDSVACHIDSVAGSNIYFRMMNRHVWVNTNIGMDEVTAYTYNAITQKEVKFKRGSTQIQSGRMKADTNLSIRSIQKNSVFVGFVITALTFNYERIVPLTDKMGLSFRGGAGYDFYNKNLLAMVETNLLVGGAKHYFELGLGYQVPASFPGFIIVRPGYRYQAVNGFLFKLYPLYFYNLSNDDDWKHFAGIGFGFGYTF